MAENGSFLTSKSPLKAVTKKLPSFFQGGVGGGYFFKVLQWLICLYNMSSFRYSIGLPFSSDIVEKGTTDKEAFLKVFEDFQWMDLWKEMDEAENSVNGKEIFQSPSLNLENTANKNEILICLDGGENLSFIIFYVRPELRKSFFGLFEKYDEKYMSERQNQTKADALEAINALFDNDLALLKSRWG